MSLWKRTTPMSTTVIQVPCRMVCSIGESFLRRLQSCHLDENNDEREEDEDNAGEQ